MQAIMQPKVEGEIAFVLGRDLTSESINSTDVMSAIDYTVVAIELLGSRIEGWDIHLTDTIADNASASHWVVGRKQVQLKNLDLINCNMVMEKNGEIVSRGVGSDCLGSPINAVLWLARNMIRLGNPMRAGQVVFTGALGQVADAEAGDNFRVIVDGLGETSVRFTR
jgi:2-keto-4-pentenoate hydratase